MNEISSKSEVNLNDPQQDEPFVPLQSIQEGGNLTTLNKQSRYYSPETFNNNIHICRLELEFFDESIETEKVMAFGSGSLFSVIKIGPRIYGIIATAAHLFYEKGFEYDSGEIIFQSKQMEDFEFDILTIVTPKQYRNIIFAENEDLNENEDENEDEDENENMEKYIYDFAFVVTQLNKKKTNEIIAKDFLKTNGWLHEVSQLQSMLDRQDKNDTVNLSLLSPYEHDVEWMNKTGEIQAKIGYKRYSGKEMDKSSLRNKFPDNFPLDKILTYDVSTFAGQSGAIVGSFSKEDLLFFPKAIHIAAHEEHKEDGIFCNKGRNIFPDVIDFGQKVIEELASLIKLPPHIITEWETEELDQELLKEEEKKEEEGKKKKKQEKQSKKQEKSRSRSPDTCKNPHGIKRKLSKRKEIIKQAKHRDKEEENSDRS